LQRWLLRGADRVLVHSAAAAKECPAFGAIYARLRPVPPAVDPGLALPVNEPAAPDLPVGAKCIVCLGDLDLFIPFRDTIWAFDILRHLSPALQLWFLGAGPARARLTRFATGIRAGDQVRFLGDVPPGPALARADVVWTPGQGEAGMFDAL